MSNGKMSSNVPADMINLRLILVSGKTKEFLFSPNDSASDIAKHVYDNWPMDWEEEQVSSPNILRLIYQGRFLHGNVTLGGVCRPQWLLCEACTATAEGRAPTVKARGRLSIKASFWQNNSDAFGGQRDLARAKLPRSEES
uniref:Ubiquitin-like protein 3 n=1 Tax=Capra hircus TaxID=9925 RepID=A0A8C2P648_CAPHI